MSAATGTTRFVHELVLYDGAAGLLDAVLPFVEDGLRAGERTVLRMPEEQVHDVLDAVGESATLEVLPHDEHRRPTSDLHAFRQRFDTLGPAERVRVVNVMPPLDPQRWSEWRRYEAAVNDELAPYPVWGLCLYDAGRLGPSVRHDLERTHPRTGHGGVHGASPRYAGPRAVDHDWAGAPSLPEEAGAPDAELVDPPAALARQVVARHAREADLGAAATDALLAATSEVVHNAWTHGRPPVVLRLWSPPGRLVLTVTDTGPGPSDPFVGLVARDARYGLWLVHHTVDVVHRTHGSGYTIALTIRP